MKERIRVVPAVFVAVIDEDKVLLHERYNTGYKDGRFDLPSGHLEADELPNEAAARELREEVGLGIDPKSLTLAHIFMNNETILRPYMGLVYRVELKETVGTPQIKEPHKCRSLGFFALNNLPENTTTQVRSALQGIFENTVSHIFHP